MPILNSALFTDGEIADFQRLWTEHFGEDISKEAAILEGLKVFDFVKGVYEKE